MQRSNSVSKWLDNPLRTALVVFAAALILRLLVLLALHGSPYWSAQLVDAKLYDDWAVALSEGKSPHPAPFFYSPVYPWSLSILYRVFGHSLYAARLLQCILGSMLCVLVYLLGRRLLSWQAALGAGLFCALFGPLIFFDNLLLKTAPVTFLLFAGIYLLYLEPERKSLLLVRFLLAGVALGLAAGMRGNAVLVAAAVLIFLAIEALRKKAYIPPVLVLAGMLVSILPLTISNYASSGEFILATYSGGFNFYEGNSAEATGYHPALASVRQTAEHEQQDAIEAARRAIGRTPTPKEVSAYWSQKAWRDIGADPGRWFRLLSYKAALFANHAEIPDNYNYSFLSKQLTPLYCNPLGFWILAPFALAGLGLAIARGGQWRLIVLVVFVYSGSVVLFYVTARYRAPVVPFLALLAALTVEQLVAWLKKQDFQRALVLCVVIFGLFAAVAKPLVPEKLGFDREHYALGNMEMERGNFENAIENYLSAIDSGSSSPEIENNLGAAYLSAAGMAGANRSIYLEAAAFHLRLAVELNPYSFKAWKNLGLAQSAAGRTKNARKALLKALDLAPDRQRYEKVRRILKSISQ